MIKRESGFRHVLVKDKNTTPEKIAKMEKWFDKREGENYATCKARRGEWSSLKIAFKLKSPEEWGLKPKDVLTCIKKSNRSVNQPIIDAIKKGWISPEIGASLFWENTTRKEISPNSLFVLNNNWPDLFPKEKIRELLTSFWGSRSNATVAYFYGTAEAESLRRMFPDLVSDNDIMDLLKGFLRIDRIDKLFYNDSYAKRCLRLLKMVDNWESIVSMIKIMES